MWVAIVLQMLLLLILGFFICYLLFLTTFALVHHRKIKSHQDADRLHRFAVVVPAHNEESSIASTLYSIFHLDYPRSFYTVFVVADNCTDSTAIVARRQGSHVLERWEPARRGKGHTLRWCFDRLLQHQPGYDAIVVIDADSIVSPNFLKVMNSFLTSGERVIQASDLVNPTSDVWVSNSIRIGFFLYNQVRPLGREYLGFSVGLRGNGMCFTTDTLRTVPWEAYSLNEDLEYGIILLLNGIRVSFAPNASVLATMPQHARNAESQRARWEAGRFDIVRRYALPLLVQSFKNRSIRMLDALIDLLTPPFTNMVALIIAMILGNLVILSLTDSGGLMLSMWIGLLLLAGCHVLLGMQIGDRRTSIIRSFLQFHRYLLWKLELYLRLLRKGRDREWIRTTREE